MQAWLCSSFKGSEGGREEGGRGIIWQCPIVHGSYNLWCTSAASNHIFFNCLITTYFPSSDDNGEVKTSTQAKRHYRSFSLLSSTFIHFHQFLSWHCPLRTDWWSSENKFLMFSVRWKKTQNEYNLIVNIYSSLPCNWRFLLLWFYEWTAWPTFDSGFHISYHKNAVYLYFTILLFLEVTYKIR